MNENIADDRQRRRRCLPWPPAAEAFGPLEKKKGRRKRKRKERKKRKERGPVSFIFVWAEILFY